eukprot:CAMPEP_0197058802 /NCGR_PEP_ID=MMETSP1384-20130603/111449_1 /TAXON_ID=29189 /ORGANISM="Ammonia sp." /LENGTH=79 /DNA_ID=CAMNT_0042493687 /DNA_START=66 /DNA_END=302 /DNA_ORIENTATION=-
MVDDNKEDTLFTTQLFDIDSNASAMSAMSSGSTKSVKSSGSNSNATSTSMKKKVQFSGEVNVISAPSEQSSSSPRKQPQ